MLSLQNVCNALLISHSPNLIRNEQFLTLYDFNTLKNPDFSCWNYQQFDLNLSDEKCKAEFRLKKTTSTFSKKHYIYVLRSFFQTN